MRAGYLAGLCFVLWGIYCVFLGKDKDFFLFSPFSWEKALPFFKNGDIIFRQIVERAPEPCVWGPLYVGAAGAPRGGGRPLP